MLHITYFGSLKEHLNIKDEYIPWDCGSSDDLLQLLRARGPIWNDALAPINVYKLAINHEIIHETSPVIDGSEIAILPPVTGG